jgi:hypothetical protein
MYWMAQARRRPSRSGRNPSTVIASPASARSMDGRRSSKASGPSTARTWRPVSAALSRPNQVS